MYTQPSLFLEDLNALIHKSIAKLECIEITDKDRSIDRSEAAATRAMAGPSATPANNEDRRNCVRNPSLPLPLTMVTIRTMASLARVLRKDVRIVVTRFRSLWHRSLLLLLLLLSVVVLWVVVLCRVTCCHRRIPWLAVHC